MENKRVVKKDLTREDIQQKIADALAKKPTNSGSPRPNEESLAKQKFVRERLVRNAKNKKRFRNRPPVIQTIAQNELTFNDVPFYHSLTYEYPTPEWFRTTQKVDVSVIIPLFKSNEVLLDLIRSWQFDNKLNVEIIFVDDNCPNQSKEIVIKAFNSRKAEIKKPIGKILVNKVNGGYGAACNAGASVATGDFLIFLNADTELTQNWIKPIVDVFEDQTVGLVGNLQLKRGGGWDGTIDSAGSEWRWGDDSFVHIGRHSYKKSGIAQPMKPELAPKDVMQVGEREMVTGCCFAIKAKLFNYIGGLNPNYRIGYWEDSEICMNVKELGYKVMFTPHSVIYHKLGHTSSGGHKFFRYNKEYFFNKWVKSGRLHKLLLPPEKGPVVNSILIKRTSAHGDALVAAGVCAALKKQHPNAEIYFSSLFSELAQNNPYIDKIVEIKDIRSVSPDVFYNLDLAYEWRPNTNILTAYAELCGVKKEDCVVHLPQKQYEEPLPEEFIIIHPGRTDWVGRDWPHENFVQLANILLERGERIVCVGKHSEGQIPCTLDLRGKTTIAELTWIMAKSKLFIGIDSFPMHIAQVANIPGIAFFGCVKPELRIFNKKMSGITAQNLACLGCHHRKPAPSTVTKNCETGTHDCVKKVSVQEMLDAVDKKLAGKIELPSF
jgi:ADP-heptose:LPS heptosyltransferase/GT2 family glycosyltransferase